MKTDCPDCVWNIDGHFIKSFTPCDACKRTTLHDTRLGVSPVFVFHQRIQQHHMDVLQWEHDGRQGPRPTIEFPEAEQNPRELPGIEWPDMGHSCLRCGKDMRYAAVHGPNRGDPEELSNECNLIFVGGYGSFIDTGLGDPWPMLSLCHECGHELCVWLGVDPRNWHTHSIYGGQHEDHHDNQELFRPPDE